MGCCSRPDITKKLKNHQKYMMVQIRRHFLRCIMRSSMCLILEISVWSWNHQGMKNYGIRKIVCFSDSNYAGDLVGKRSVTWFIWYVLVVPGSCHPNMQRSMMLSRSEAEWASLLETVKEIMFVIQLLLSMKISIKVAVTVKVNNVETIFMDS